MAKDLTLKLEKFTGLFCPGGNASLLRDSDSPDMVNFRVTQGYQLKRREGFSTRFLSDAPLRGIWCGHLEGERQYLAVAGDELLASAEGFDRLETVGHISAGTGRVSFFPFHGALYLLTGNGIYLYDGKTVAPIEPYVPILTISTEPSGAGVPYEEANLLTRSVRQKFSPDGTARRFRTAVSDITGIEKVLLNGHPLEEDLYFWDEGAGVVELLNTPLRGIDTLEVQYRLYGEDLSERILTCRFATAFGGASDTRAFLYGSPDHGAVRFHSALVDGRPSMTYFPETAVSLVGTGEPITSIVRHYDRQLIFTSGSAYYSYLEYREGAEGQLQASFPVLPLNDERGCVPEGQALLVENTPVTLARGGLTMWVSTNIRDERNAKGFSEPIEPVLAKAKGEDAILFHRKEHSELYLVLGDRVYVYSIPLGLFYVYDVSGILGFCQEERRLYFYRKNAVLEVGGDRDDGEAICARWRSKLWDFGDKAREKKLFRIAFYAQCGGQEEMDLTLRGENETEKIKKRVRFSGKPDGERIRLRCFVRRFRALEAVLETKSSSALCLWGLELGGRRYDGESK